MADRLPHRIIQNAMKVLYKEHPQKTLAVFILLSLVLYAKSAFCTRPSTFYRASGRGFKCIVISTLYLKDRGCFFAFTHSVDTIGGYRACGYGSSKQSSPSSSVVTLCVTIMKILYLAPPREGWGNAPDWQGGVVRRRSCKGEAWVIVGA